MSRFPKITETFIMYEILELERLGLRVEVFPLIRERAAVQHPEAAQVVERAHFSRPLSWTVLAAQAYWLRRRPRAYLRAWWHALRGNAGSPKFLSRALAALPQAAWFARQMQTLGVEHVHAHFATHPTLAAYVIKQLAGLPYSFTAHAHDIYVERPMLEQKIDAASFVVTISDYNRRLLEQLYGRSAAEKTRVIHCGVDPAVFAPGGERAAGERFTLLCVASLQEYKGHAYLLEALAHLSEKEADWQCVLVGDGEARAALEAQAQRLGLGERVQFRGAQPREAVSRLLASADVVVQPSITVASGKKEGIPVALMEALASERAVVATAISGVPELIENNSTGLLVPERDAPALAAALLRLYSEPQLRRALGAAGRAKVLRDFDLKTNSARLFELLNRDWRLGSAERQAGDAVPLNSR